MFICLQKMTILFFAVAISMVYAAAVESNSLSVKDADRLGLLFNANESRMLSIIYFSFDFV